MVGGGCAATTHKRSQEGTVDHCHCHQTTGGDAKMSEIETTLDGGVACSLSCTEDPSDEGTLLVQICVFIYLSICREFGQ